MKPHKVNELDNFIAGWYFEDTSICDKLIKYFNKKSTKKESGRVADSYTIAETNTVCKNSLDAQILDQSLLIEYLTQLKMVLENYRKMYPYCDNVPYYQIECIPQIQYYVPKTGGFHVWHSERTINDPSVIHRHLVFMTYLNDVTDGGETEWYHQKLKIKPEKGLTVIWPTDWTFVHRGCVSETQKKYIVTGWYNISQKT